MRSLLVVLVAGLALAPAAQAKTGWEADRDWLTLVPGEKTDVVLTAIDHRSGGSTPAFEGMEPTLYFERISNGSVYTFKGSPADAKGRSTVSVTLPGPGVWLISVKVGDRMEGGWPPVDIKGPAKAAAPPPAADDGGGRSPALLVAAGLVVLLATGAAVVSRRRPRIGGA